MLENGNFELICGFHGLYLEVIVTEWVKDPWEVVGNITLANKYFTKNLLYLNILFLVLCPTPKTILSLIQSDHNKK